MSAQKRPAEGVIDDRRTRYLYWWLLVAIFFEYARPGAFVPLIEAVKLNSLIPLGLLAVTLFAPGLRPFKEIFGDRYSKWLTAYLALIVISVPFAEITLYAYTMFKGVLGYFFLFIIITRVVTSIRRLHGVFLALFMSHAFLIAMTPEVVTNPSVRTYISGGTFLGDGNDFSLSLCILLPMAIELARSEKSKLFRAASWGFFGLFLLAIIASQSRGATVALVVLFGFLWLFGRRKVLGLIAIGFVGLLVAMYASDGYFERMSTIVSYQGEGSAEDRIVAWKSALRMAADSPLIGVGAGNFPAEFGARYQPGDRAPMRWMSAHSLYFQVLSELGFPGIVVVLALVFGHVRMAMIARRHLLKPKPGPPSPTAVAMARSFHLLAGSAVAFAVAGAFLSVAYYPHIFVLTGILLCARSVIGDKSNLGG